MEENTSKPRTEIRDGGFLIRISASERQGLDRVARKLGMSKSQALRLLVKAMDEDIGAKLDHVKLQFESQGAEVRDDDSP